MPVSRDSVSKFGSRKMKKCNKIIQKYNEKIFVMNQSLQKSEKNCIFSLKKKTKIEV